MKNLRTVTTPEVMVALQEANTDFVRIRHDMESIKNAEEPSLAGVYGMTFSEGSHTITRDVVIQSVTAWTLESVGYDL